MSKTIVYLDQNFASNLGKARARRLADEKWLHLYEVLDDLVHNQQKVICPESFFHQTESSLSHELLSAINEVVVRLSWGLQLIPWQEALPFQVYRAMCMFLGKQVDAPHWREAFTHDPDEPTTARSMHFKGGEFLLHVRWHRLPEFIEGDERIKDRYPALMAAVKRAVAGTDFPTQVEEEKRAFVEYHYTAPLRRALEAFLSPIVPTTLSDFGVLQGARNGLFSKRCGETLAAGRRSASGRSSPVSTSRRVHSWISSLNSTPP